MTNISTGVMLYNFADPNLNATVAGAVITFLDVSTTGMAASEIQVIMEDGSLPSASLVPERHTKVEIAYAGDTETLVYKDGATPVATLIVTKDGEGNVLSVERQ